MCKDPLHCSEYIVSLIHVTQKPQAAKSALICSHCYESVMPKTLVFFGVHWIFFPKHLPWDFLHSPEWMTYQCPFHLFHPLYYLFIPLSPSLAVVEQEQQQIQRRPLTFSPPTSPSSLWTAGGTLVSSWPSTYCRICCTGLWNTRHAPVCPVQQLRPSKYVEVISWHSTLWKDKICFKQRTPILQYDLAIPHMTTDTQKFLSYKLSQCFTLLNEQMKGKRG